MGGWGGALPRMSPVTVQWCFQPPAGLSCRADAGVATTFLARASPRQSGAGHLPFSVEASVFRVPLPRGQGMFLVAADQLVPDNEPLGSFRLLRVVKRLWFVDVQRSSKVRGRGRPANLAPEAQQAGPRGRGRPGLDARRAGSQHWWRPCLTEAAGSGVWVVLQSRLRQALRHVLLSPSVAGQESLGLRCDGGTSCDVDTRARGWPADASSRSPGVSKGTVKVGQHVLKKGLPPQQTMRHLRPMLRRRNGGGRALACQGIDEQVEQILAEDRRDDDRSQEPVGSFAAGSRGALRTAAALPCEGSPSVDR